MIGTGSGCRKPSYEVCAATLALLSLCSCAGSRFDHECHCAESTTGAVQASALAVKPPPAAMTAFAEVVAPRSDPEGELRQFLRDAAEQARTMHRGGRWVDRVIEDENWRPVPIVDLRNTGSRPDPGGSGPAINSSAAVAMAVGYLVLPERSNLPCTGWLIARDKIVTNHHCVADKMEARSARITFDYVMGADEVSLAWYDCSTFIDAWADIDAAVLRCHPLDGKAPGERYGVLKLASVDPKAGEPVYLVHNICNYMSDPGCDRVKQISPGRISQTDYGPVDFTHTADTLNGSSGAPILADSGPSRHQVIGMHHHGCTRVNDCTAESHDGRGAFNIGVRAQALRLRLAGLGI